MYNVVTAYITKSTSIQGPMTVRKIKLSASAGIINCTHCDHVKQQNPFMKFLLRN